MDFWWVMFPKMFCNIAFNKCSKIHKSFFMLKISVCFPQKIQCGKTTWISDSFSEVE